MCWGCDCWCLGFICCLGLFFFVGVAVLITLFIKYWGRNIPPNWCYCFSPECLLLCIPFNWKAYTKSIYSMKTLALGCHFLLNKRRNPRIHSTPSLIPITVKSSSSIVVGNSNLALLSQNIHPLSQQVCHGWEALQKSSWKRFLLKL